MVHHPCRWDLRDLHCLLPRELESEPSSEGPASDGERMAPANLPVGLSERALRQRLVARATHARIAVPPMRDAAGIKESVATTVVLPQRTPPESPYCPRHGDAQHGCRRRRGAAHHHDWTTNYGFILLPLHHASNIENMGNWSRQGSQHEFTVLFSHAGDSPVGTLLYQWRRLWREWPINDHTKQVDFHLLRGEEVGAKEPAVPAVAYNADTENKLLGLVELLLARVDKLSAVVSSQGQVIAALRDQNGELRAKASETLDAVNQLRAVLENPPTVPPPEKQQATFAGALQKLAGPGKLASTAQRTVAQGSGTMTALNPSAVRFTVR
ncbi:hypothetical protein HPB47_025960 [Ixodes persulcatus]|uniref:Uncharacterized protein n=1 Tax=Ixodes persulcatus TaxID=34615 RepID=A0AC60Q0I3_IXOPE|nr:hypothetical protein HPB47_025960 [Ixodes persulcatus]